MIEAQYIADAERHIRAARGSLFVDTSSSADHVSEAWACLLKVRDDRALETSRLACTLQLQQFALLEWLPTMVRHAANLHDEPERAMWCRELAEHLRAGMAWLELHKSEGRIVAPLLDEAQPQWLDMLELLDFLAGNPALS